MDIKKIKIAQSISFINSVLSRCFKNFTGLQILRFKLLFASSMKMNECRSSKFEGNVR